MELSRDADRASSSSASKRDDLALVYSKLEGANFQFCGVQGFAHNPNLLASHGRLVTACHAFASRSSVGGERMQADAVLRWHGASGYSCCSRDGTYV